MIRDLGIIQPGTTIYVPFHTFDSNDPSASVTLTGLATTDIEIYKDGSTTQRASDAGYALLDTDGIDFDTITGIHGISIDLADNTTAGFYAAGSQYWVVISSITVDAATINFVLCTFRIGYDGAVLNTTIATLASQTSFTLTAGPAEDDALNNCQIVIHDVASAVQVGRAVILDYTGSTKTVTLAAGTTFTAAATDNVAILGLAPLIPTTAGRTLDVSTGGEAGVDWANVGTPGSTVSLSATTVATVTTTGTATNVTTVNGLAANVITATSIQADAITAAKVASDVSAEIADAVWDEDATGHQTQGTFGQAIGDPVADTNTIFKAVVTDATGATVGADVAAILDDTGTAGVVVASLAAGSITAAAIATGAIDADALAADAGTEIGTAVWATATRVLTAGTNVDGSTFTAIPWNAAWDAEVQSEVQDAIEANHLDHLLAVTYDPASKPGAADALLNELVESDAGVARYTANALEQAPTGGSAPTASQIADEVQTRTIAGVTLVATTTNLTNLPTIPANWLTAAGTAADFGAEIGTAVRTELATELARIDAAVTTRMATYTQPTGFLAATFPTTVASTTNITAGTITTVTTLTNLPAITSNWLTADGLAADAGVEIAAAVWDRVLSGATHNIASSAGRRLRQLDATSIIDGTAAAGASNSITLDGTASATNDIYDENLIVITEGTGAGQTRVIVEYNGTTKVAIVNRVWQTNPSTDSVYEIIAGAQADIAQHGLAQGGTASTITLSAAASATDDIYIGSQVYISTSTGTGQTRLITDYNGTTKVATVSPDWVTNPTSASVYKVIPIGRAIVDSGTVTTVTGSVGSVTGNVGGNVVGSVASVTGNVGGNVVGSVASVTAAVTLPTIPTAWITADGIAADAIGSSELAASAVTEIQSGLATAASIAALNNLSAAQVNTEVDTALADYDGPTNTEMVARTLAAAAYATAAAQSTAQMSIDDIPTNAELSTALGTADDATLAAIATLQTYVDTEVAAIKAKTDNLPAAPAATGDIPTVSQIWTTALTEAYRATGATGTAAQLLYELIAHMGESSISSTTKTLKKLDGSTTAKTYMLNDATTPTAITETT